MSMSKMSQSVYEVLRYIRWKIFSSKIAQLTSKGIELSFRISQLKIYQDLGRP
jgi:hypothetical protein